MGRENEMFDGSAACAVCSCRVMIPAGKTSKKLRRALALADHAKVLHATRHWSEKSTGDGLTEGWR